MTTRLPFVLLAAVACGSLAFAPGGEDPQAPDTYQVRLETSAGPVVIDVTRELAPRGADRFYRLVKEGYYDDMRVFRVVDGFVAQFGMAGDPKVNAQWREARIKDDPVKVANKPGTVTFATSGPDSRTTQLFINLGDNSGPPAQLDDQGFAPFGRVIEGMENVEQFYKGYGERPQQPRIGAQGNAYLDAQFPKLTKIETARVVSENGQPVEEAQPAE